MLTKNALRRNILHPFIAMSLCIFSVVACADEGICSHSKNTVAALVFKEPQGGNAEFSSGHSFLVICENKIIHAWALASTDSDLGTFPVIQITPKSDTQSSNVVAYGNKETERSLYDGENLNAATIKGVQSVAADKFVLLLEKHRGADSGVVQIYGNSLFSEEPQLSESDKTQLQAL